MQLEKVKIVNFRSIEDLVIDFEQKCRVLVGINEAGKSNILKAMALLDPQKANAEDDIRQESFEEERKNEAHIEFFFSFDNIQKELLFQKILERLLTKNTNPVFLTKDDTPIALKELCELKGNCSYKIDLLKKEKNFKYFAFSNPHEYKISENIKLISDRCPNNYVIEIQDVGKITLAEYTLLDTDNIDCKVPDEYLETCKISDLNKLLKEDIGDLFQEVMPKTIYWKFEKENLLPHKVNIEKFMENPNVCVPLKNMFEIADYTDIQKSISEERKRKNGLKNLLTRVAKTATKHFKTIWNEYNNVEFELDLNGDNIEPAIKDDYNAYGLDQRSDGFQRFITFLLMISIKVRNKSMKDALLIVDEPEISLHPIGAKFLRNELSKIALDNYVIYSTHSPFMIDEKNIDKHYRVRKEKEKTIVLKTNESDYMDEEVLYNAIGYSIFRSLKEVNIIFEGWRDKKLFKTALKSNKLPNKIKKQFENIGLAHSKGVISIKNITPIIELANRKCIIISDCDEPAKKEEEKFNELKIYGDWKKYNDINSECTEITGEDFINVDVYKNVANKIIKQETSIATEISKDDLEHKNGKNHALSLWLKNNGVNAKENQKVIIDSIKEYLFKNIKEGDIEDSYFDFIKNLSKYLEK